MKEEEHLIEIQSRSSLRSNLSAGSNYDAKSSWESIASITLPIVLSLIVLAYLSLFLLSFIPPIFFNYSALTAIDPQAEANIDWLFCFQFCLSLFEFSCLTISFILVHCTKGAEIPSSPIWSLKVVKTHSPQEKMEEIALQFVQREEYLTQNKNHLPLLSHQSNDSLFQGSTITSITGPNSSIGYNDYIIINERKANNEIRYCKRCNKFKPDRARHCDQCNKCYLKFDHHSVWFNKCISYSNYKYYITFIFYGWNISLLFLIKYIAHFRFVFQYDQLLRTKICFCLAYSLTLLLFIASFLYWRYNIFLVFNNFTSFEYMKCKTNERYEKRNHDAATYSQLDPLVIKEKYSSMKSASRYYISKWENWTQLFGYNLFLWFIPIRSEFKENEGNNEGMVFKINHFYAIELVKSI